MGDEAPDQGDQLSTTRSLAARDAGGVMLGLAALLDRRTFDDAVDPRLVATTIRRLRRVGNELVDADEDARSDEQSVAPPDGVAWATQLSWLLAHGHTESAASEMASPRSD